MHADPRSLRLEFWHQARQTPCRDRDLKDDPAFLGVVVIRVAALWALLPAKAARRDAQLSLRLAKLDPSQHLSVSGHVTLYVSVRDDRSGAGEL